MLSSPVLAPLDEDGRLPAAIAPFTDDPIARMLVITAILRGATDES